MARAGGMIALPGPYVWSLGAVLIFVGAFMPAWWAFWRTRAYAPAELNVRAVGDGPLRPSMILLPAMPDGRQFAISERPVTFGELVRVVGGIAIDAACGERRLSRDLADKPVDCLLGLSQATAYANLLTDEENRARGESGRALLTRCYRSDDAVAAAQDCTGYRLPTVKEWTYVATAGSSAPDGATGARCKSEAWFLADLCDRPEIAMTEGAPAAAVSVKIDDGKVLATAYATGRTATFRIVATAQRQTDAAMLQSAEQALKEKRYGDAFNLYRLAADQGNAQAEVQLGNLYANGLGVAEDNALAVGWYRKAAEQGLPLAASSLGFMYMNGLGVPVDYSQALRWNQNAAASGDRKGLENLSRQYREGLGVDKNDTEAQQLMGMAQAGDFARAGR
jgi:TPR repeat protein